MDKSRRVLGRIVSADQTHRVTFYQNSDGSFGYEQEKFADAPEELVWIPVSSQTAKFYDSLETAKQEAWGAVEWLKEQGHGVGRLVDDVELIDLMQRFVDGPDRSVAAAHKIEGILLERYADTELFEKLTYPLATYSPGAHGEPGLYSEKDLVLDLQNVLSHKDQF